MRVKDEPIDEEIHVKEETINMSTLYLFPTHVFEGKNEFCSKLVSSGFSKQITCLLKFDDANFYYVACLQDLLSGSDPRKAIKSACGIERHNFDDYIAI